MTHNFHMTEATVHRLWNEAYGTPYPSELPLEKGAESVQMFYGFDQLRAMGALEETDE